MPHPPGQDAAAHARMFGARPRGGRRYWPALGHRELADSDIGGCGGREMAHALEKAVLAAGRP